MCRVLGIHRSMVYRHAKAFPKDEPDPLTSAVKNSFKQSKGIYGARKIKADLSRQGIIISRRRVRKNMAQEGLNSVYTVKKYRPAKRCNEQALPNLVDRKFHDRAPLEVVVSDLTYVKIEGRWAYLCPVADLFNREVIGWSVGHQKNGQLVQDAFLEIPYNLNQIDMVHSDRGKEFEHQLLQAMTESFAWNRSLSRKGNPWDNAVMESLNHVIKTEFVGNRSFESMAHFKMDFFEYIHWYNHHRLHGSLGYKTPIEYRQSV